MHPTTSTPDRRPTPSQVSQRRVCANGITLNVAITETHAGGETPAILLVHGWPHTWQVWSRLISRWAGSATVVAPDLRGIGASDRPSDGYDAATLAEDLLALLDALGIEQAWIVAIDAGVAPATLFALDHPERVSGLAVMEGLAGSLPGAEAFLHAGPPWWFGFHAVPQLAERVLAGNEAAYVDFFLRAGTVDDPGVPEEIRRQIIEAYSRPDGLRGGFEIYRAMPLTAEQLTAAAARSRLTVPALAIAGGVVGEAIGRQLGPIADDLSQARIANCAHIIPLDRPDDLAATIEQWMTATAGGGYPV